MAFLFRFVTLKNVSAQTEFKKMVDASAKTLPYDEYSVSVLTKKIKIKMY